MVEREAVTKIVVDRPFVTTKPIKAGWDTDEILRDRTCAGLVDEGLIPSFPDPVTHGFARTHLMVSPESPPPHFQTDSAMET